MVDQKMAIDKGRGSSYVRSIPDAAHVAKLLRPGATRRHFALEPRPSKQILEQEVVFSVFFSDEN